MISNIYARRDGVELVSPERVSGAAKTATLPDFVKSFDEKIGMDDEKIGMELR